MKREEAEALVKQHGSQQAAARNARCAKSTIWAALHSKSSAHGTPTARGRSLSEFRQTYDKSTIIPSRVRAALKTLAGGWEYEVQFAKLAGVSLADLGLFRDEFAGHVVTLREGRRAWAGTVKTAQAMREML